MKFVDLTGQRFGNLVVTSFNCRRRYPGGGVASMWNCKCDCGNKTVVSNSSLRNGTKSCGCKAKRCGKDNHFYKHGDCNTRIYKVWSDMKKRCNDKNYKDYSIYGGKGVKVCEEWSGDNGYENFRDWAYKNGYNKDAPRGKCTLDRVDVNGDYEPQNCRWVDAKRQANNRTTSRTLTYHGMTHTIAEWADILGVSYGRIQGRVYLGWETEDIIEIGKLKANRNHQKIIRKEYKEDNGGGE